MQKVLDRNPLIIAHRGDSINAPENTIAAFEMAYEKGADGIEFDVQLSRDSVPVVIHDLKLKRTGRRKGKVAELTASELGTIDVGSWFNAKHPESADPRFVHEAVPTLAEVLEVAKKFDGPIYIELKCCEADHERLARAVCDHIRDSQQLSQMIIKSFRLAVIPLVRLYLPEVQTATLFAPRIMHLLRNKRNIIALAREFDSHQLSLQRSLATRKLVALARDERMSVAVWTADDPKWVDRCRERGIKALITNDPATLLAARDSVKVH